MELAALIADSSVDPSTLPVSRLTFKEYDGTGKQTDADKNKDAMNPGLALNSGINGWGTVNMHAVEMRTSRGIELLYVSNKRRLMNSNEAFGTRNHNFNLHLADIRNNGTLGADRQFQYYTTTSALSPAPLRSGVAFSYQASTADNRNWQIQSSDASGRWAPLIGYGSNPELFHLGALCIQTGTDNLGNPPGDYFLATKYYNKNNKGFGALWKINMADVGINSYDGANSFGVLPRQKNARNISLNVISGDNPSGQNGNGDYYGKITSPRCGRPDDLLMAYTPTSANGRKNDPDGNKHIYEAYIAYRLGFDDFDPTDPVDVAQNTGLRILVDDSDNAFNLVWPVPLLSWLERTGEAQQQIAPPAIDPDTTITAGDPFAQIGTSALYNTDRKPFDCWLGSGGNTPYNPNLLNNNHKDKVWKNFDGLAWVQNQADFCEDLLPANVLGIRIQITSNDTDHDCCKSGYETVSDGPTEAVTLLGVFDIRSQADQSFQAIIPSNIPFEFHLLDRRYGMRLADVRSWHSLQPRETRTNCGGCHQHEEGRAIPFDGTVADHQPPADFTGVTPRLTYDASCNPILTVDPTPTSATPEWQTDIWPQLDLYCGGCHNTTVAPPTEPGLNALGYSDEKSAYDQLRDRFYGNGISGALGSPAFWAARGERTDGRDDSLYQPGGGFEGSGGDWPYRFSTLHGMDPGLCMQNDPVKAAWVYALGQFFDGDSPRNQNNSDPRKYDHDWYHPAVDVAATDLACKATVLRIGYWDDTGSLADVQTLLNDVLIHTTGPKGNGFHKLSGLTLKNKDRVKVIAIDSAGNRQIYEKRVRQLKDECEPTGISVDPFQTLP